MTTSKTSTKPASRRKAAAAKPRARAARAADTATEAATTLPGTAPGAKAPAPKVIDAPTPVVVGPVMRKKEIVEAVVTRSGMKKSEVRPVVEGLLSVLADALGEGRELVLPPFGRIKTHKRKDKGGKTIYFSKIHQGTAAGPKDEDAAAD